MVFSYAFFGKVLSVRLTACFYVRPCVFLDKTFLSVRKF
jgi:hypothetical protein